MSSELESFADKGFLISPEVLDKISIIGKEKILEKLDGNIVVVNLDIVKCVEENKNKKMNWVGFDNARVLLEKTGDELEYNSFLNVLFGERIVSEEIQSNGLGEVKNEGGETRVTILHSFNEKSKKLTVGDFVALLNNRYKTLKEILCNRLELREAVSISRILNKNNERVAIIGIVESKRITKNDNVMLVLEDPSGKVNVIINRTKNGMKEIANEIVLDEVIGVVGNAGNGFIFADKILFPEAPLTKELKKSPLKEYAVFISDLHVGSKNFLEKDFNNFLNWLSGRDGDEVQKEIMERVKYLFVIGDLIEGIGVYPGQENDLKIKDYREQYRKLAEFLGRIPEKISIILCPGNHDAVRLDEPQPALGKELLGELFERKNLFSVSNPALVNIGAEDGFPGFDVLIYHGGSFTYYADAVDSIRLEGGQKRADLIMKFLLQKRHLAPTHTSTTYLAGNRDNLVIEKVPDFFVSGHIHRCSATNYNNVTLLNCSCWFPQSDYQEKRGLEPEPSRCIAVNLNTREVKIIYFGDEGEQTNN